MNSLFKPTSYEKGAALAVGATFVWKFISFLNALLLAAYFGATYKTDVYFYVIMVLGFGIAFMQRLNQTVLIPEAMFLQTQEPASAPKFLTMWLYVYVWVAGTVGILGTTFATTGWGIISRFTTAELAAEHTLLVLAVWWMGLQLISYYLQAIAEMYKYFSTAWLGILNALCPLVCLCVFGRHIGPASMLYGFIAANLIQIGILLVLYGRGLGFSLVPAYYPLTLRMRQNMVAGQSLALVDILTGLLPIYLISGLGSGLITALNYCRQFTDSTTEIFTARVANVAKISITEQAAAHQKAPLNEQFLMSTRLLVTVLAPLAVFSCYFAPQIVALFLERGQFTPQDTHQTVLFLRPMLFVMLLSAPGYIQNSTLAACRKIKESFPYCLTAAGILIALLLGVVPLYGAFSYPYVLGAGLVIGFLLNAVFFRKYIPFVAYGQHMRLTLRLTGFAAVALLPAIGVSKLLPPGCWVQITGCGLLFVGIYGFLLGLLNELQLLRKFFRNNF